MKSISRWILLPAILFCLFGCNRSDHATRQSATAETSGPAANSPTAGQTPALANSEYAENHPKIDACSLLTSSEIESVQGEAIKATKLSVATEGGLNVSQCFYTLPTFTNSISLQVKRKGVGAGARDPREFWRDTFHRQPSHEGERERGREEERQKVAEKKEEEEEQSAPLKVDGVADEAFWLGGNLGGALYVLKGDKYLRISIGGGGDQSSRIKKSVALAQKAIARL